jgi:hypothetical protein
MKTKAIRTLLVSAIVSVLAACSGQDVVGTQSESKAGSSAQSSPNSKQSLLDSLAKEYPNGKLPPERATQAARELAQNPSVFKKQAQAEVLTHASTNAAARVVAPEATVSAAVVTSFKPV